MTFEKLKARYDAGRLTKAMLAVYVKKGIITPEEYKLICGDDYPEGGDVTPVDPVDNEVLNILLGEDI